MKVIRNLFFLFLFLFSLTTTVFTQPERTCVLDYNPFEIKELGFSSTFMHSPSVSSDILKSHINSDYIFIGEAVSEVTSQAYEIQGVKEAYYKIIKVKVIQTIAGKLNIPQFVRLSVKVSCFGNTIGKVKLDKKYIFFANQIANNYFQGIISSKWSASINNIPKHELKKIIKKISDVRSGVKQPSIVGYVIKHRPNPYRDYVHRELGSASMWRFPPFKDDWRIMKFLYDPKYAKPLKKIKVFAKSLKGKIYTTKTDSEGRFTFDYLPKSDYQVFPDVPKSYLVVGKCSMNSKSKNSAGVRVSNAGVSSCDRKMRLDVQPAGTIRVKINLEQGTWKETTIPNIRFIGANSKTGEIYENYTYLLPQRTFYTLDTENKITPKRLTFAIDKLMAGEYILRISTSANGNIYYPGVKDIKKATIFKITEGETTDVNFNIASLIN